MNNKPSNSVSFGLHSLADLRGSSQLSLSTLLFQDNEDVKASVLRDAEQSQKLFLQRLFPVEMKDIKAKSHQDWLEELALKVEHSKVVASRTEVAKELKQKQDDSKEDLQKLEGQVKHYKSVLDETVRSCFSLPVYL